MTDCPIDHEHSYACVGLIDFGSSKYEPIGPETIDADHVVWELSYMSPEDFERTVRSGKVALIARLFDIKAREITKRVRELQPKHQ